MQKPIQALTEQAFAPYGRILSAPATGFQIVVAAPDANGWQAALNRVTADEAVNVHRHPNTDECFAPLEGDPVLLVAAPDTPDAVEIFRLDQPVCVHANVWHLIINHGRDALIFICEAADVTGEIHDLPRPIRPA